MHALVDGAGLSREIAVDSAGTGAWHVGERADERARATARARGFELASRARQFTRDDFERFDYVIAMDRSNRRDLVRMAPDRAAEQSIHLFRAFDPENAGDRRQGPEGSGGDADLDVPDPYYGGPRGFEDVFDICERTCRALLEHVIESHGLERPR